MGNGYGHLSDHVPDCSNAPNMHWRNHADLEWVSPRLGTGWRSVELFATDLPLAGRSHRERRHEAVIFLRQAHRDPDELRQQRGRWKGADDETLLQHRWGGGSTGLYEQEGGGR